MRTGRPTSGDARARRGFAMMLVLVLASVSLLVLAATLNWTSSQSLQLERATKTLGAVSTAEAATELVLAKMIRDFESKGETYVYGNLAAYRAIAPNAADTNWLADYRFNDTKGNLNRASVERTNTSFAFGDIPTKYSGLKGYTSTYRVMAEVTRTIDGGQSLGSAVQQDLQLVQIPLCQYFWFYAADMEMCPSQDWTINGRVHANGNIYLQPNQSDLIFLSHVTAARKINLASAPGDPTSRGSGTVTFKGERDDGTRSLNLSFAAVTNLTNWSALIDIPPVAEDPASAVGVERFYNKADLIVRVTSTNVTVTSGRYNNFSVNVASSIYTKFLTTSAYFYDKREQKTVLATDFSINDFNGQTNSLKTALGRMPRAIYIADLRPGAVNQFAGVRLIEARTLPVSGLTVATPNPLYLDGHFNAGSGQLASTNTSKAVPAGLAADSVTILSPWWLDSYSWSDLWDRPANNTTVNAAIITGNVPSGNGYYSGGAENALRLLEDWDWAQLNFNGSVAVLYPSRTATAPWGASDDVYTPPARVFSWDSNFLTQAKLPYAFPELRTVIRGSWVRLAASGLVK